MAQQNSLLINATIPDSSTTTSEPEHRLGICVWPTAMTCRAVRVRSGLGHGASRCDAGTLELALGFAFKNITCISWPLVPRVQSTRMGIEAHTHTHNHHGQHLAVDFITVATVVIDIVQPFVCTMVTRLSRQQRRPGLGCGDKGAKRLRPSCAKVGNGMQAKLLPFST